MKVNWDHLYTRRGAHSGPGSRGLGAKLKRNAIEKAIRELNVETILDIGCGDLHVQKEVDFAGADYLGIDASEVIIEKSKDNSLGLPVKHHDFLSEDLPDKFDLVLMFDVLIHVTDFPEYRLLTQKLLRTARKGLLVSGFLQPSEEASRSGVLSFQESLTATFSNFEFEILGEYRGVSLMFVKLNPEKESAKPKLWSFWENPPNKSRPQYLDLCKETWYRHCASDFDIVDLTPENVRDYLPNLIPEWDRIPVLAHKADYLRAVIVNRYGGIWLDKDTIVLKSLVPFVEKLSQSPSGFVGCGRPGKRPSNGIFCGEANSPLLAEYIEAMDSLIASRPENLKFEWTELGYRILWPLAQKYDFYQFPFRICIPIHPARWKTFFQKTRYEELSAADCDIRSDTLTAYLYNAMFPVWIKEAGASQIIRGSSVLSQLLRKGLDIPNWPVITDDQELLSKLGEIQHRKGIPEVLRVSGINHRICEIGVRTGAHLEHMVTHAEPARFFGIDPWDDGGVQSRNDAGASKIQQLKWEKQCRDRLQQFGNRGKIVKEFSFDAVKGFPDDHFDFVYIDADHSYSAVKRDIEDWYPKVRPGGILAGHDYLERKIHLVEYGVIEAVDEFVEKNGLHDNFRKTSERFASWMIVKPRASAPPRFCYWTVATGAPKFHSLARSLVRSARKCGVREDIHVWTDDGVEIDGAEIHRFDKARHHAPGHMFKIEILKEMAELDYDFLIYLDDDSFFVREPPPAAVSRILELASPFHIGQTARINSPDYSTSFLDRCKWWGIPLSMIRGEFDKVDEISGKSYFSNNGGCFVVATQDASTVISTIEEGFYHFQRSLGFHKTADEVGYSYAMAKLTNPEGHLLSRERVSDFWATNRGAFRGRLPDGNPFPVWTNWDRSRYSVNPAIVHARKSIPQLLNYGSATP